MAIMDPRAGTPPGAALPALSWAKAMPPLWQYFLRLLNRERNTHRAIPMRKVVHTFVKNSFDEVRSYLQPF